MVFKIYHPTRSGPSITPNTRWWVGREGVGREGSGGRWGGRMERRKNMEIMEDDSRSKWKNDSERPRWRERRESGVAGRRRRYWKKVKMRKVLDVRER